MFRTLVAGFFPNLLRAHNVVRVIDGKTIHAFIKSGRHLEFSTNDVIHGKIMHVAKMATKDESSVDVDFTVCPCKKENVFTLYQEEYFLYVFMGMFTS